MYRKNKKTSKNRFTHQPFNLDGNPYSNNQHKTYKQSPCLRSVDVSNSPRKKSSTKKRHFYTQNNQINGNPPQKYDQNMVNNYQILNRNGGGQLQMGKSQQIQKFISLSNNRSHEFKNVQHKEQQYLLQQQYQTMPITTYQNGNRKGQSKGETTNEQMDRNSNVLGNQSQDPTFLLLNTQNSLTSHQTSMDDNGFKRMYPNDRNISTAINSQRNHYSNSTAHGNNFSNTQSNFRQKSRRQRKLTTAPGTTSSYIATGPFTSSQQNKTNPNQKSLAKLYWKINNGQQTATQSAYLVSGVKAQYEKLKKSYEDKCFELMELRRQSNLDQVKELTIYCQKLQKQNQKLRNRLMKYSHGEKISSGSGNLTLMKSSNTQSNLRAKATQQSVNFIYKSEVYLDLADRVELMVIRIKNLQQRNKKLKQQNKTFSNRIVLVDKLLIEKQNNEFHALSKLRKLQKEQIEWDRVTKQLEVKLKEHHELYEKKLKEYQNSAIDRLEKEVQKVRLQYKDKEEEIKRLTKKSMELEMALIHQKHSNNNDGDHSGEQNGDLCDNGSYNEHQQRSYHDYVSNSNNRSSNLNRNRTDESDLVNQIPSIQVLRSNTNTSQLQKGLGERRRKTSGNDNMSRKSSQYMGESIRTGVNLKVGEMEPRVRKTADQKREGSKKERRVEMLEIEEALLYLKLKLSFRGLSAEDIKCYFRYQSVEQQNGNQNVNTFSKQASPNLSLTLLSHSDGINEVNLHTSTSTNTTNLLLMPRFGTNNENPNQADPSKAQESDQIPWEQQYITMKQVYGILANEPFGLSQEDSLKVSRYIVEDVIEQYVFMHWENQNYRKVVQSIVGNLFVYTKTDDYEVYGNGDKKEKKSVEERFKELMQKYWQNILPALRTVTGKRGYVSSDRFVEVLDSLGLERKGVLDDYMIGRMCQHSPSLEKLDFMKLNQGIVEDN